MQKIAAPPPDVVLLDLMMPKMDGFEVCRNLRKYANTAHLPVLMITALSQRGDRLMGIKAGANDFLNKPQEVTQNVFIMLARKGLWLSGEVSVAASLHKAVLLEVRHWWRGELRRRRREQSAAELGTIMKDEDSMLRALQGELDEGLLSLREADRATLILRYIEGRSHREIGVLLGMREDAARMRVSKALDRLTQFFRRRGYSVPAAATTAAALGASAKAAPAGLAATVTGAGLTAGGSSGATGFKLQLAKFMGLSKAQTAVLCTLVAATPAVWQWHVANQSQAVRASTQTRLATAHDDQAQAADDLRRLQAESAQLDGAISNALQSQARYDAAAAKLQALKSRIRGLLTDAHYQWPNDLPYARVSKAEVKSLDLLHKPGTFQPNGVLNRAAQEMLGISDAEKSPVESALSAYLKGVDDMTENDAYQSTIFTNAAGQMTNTVMVPPLGEPLKTLAANTATEISNVLGPDREQLVFGDWAQGGVQLFSPGNLWLIADEPQQFTIWINPNARPGEVNSGSSHSCQNGGGMSTGYPGGFDCIPADVFQKFFAPWLAEQGFSTGQSQPSGN